MRRRAFGMVAVSMVAAATSCGSPPCLVACTLGVDIAVKDATGAAVQLDHGTLTLAPGSPMPFTCSAANSAVTCDGGVVSAQTLGTTLSTVTLEVFDTQGRTFSGAVTMTTAPNGKEVCGQTCVQATGSATVQ